MKRTIIFCVAIVACLLASGCFHHKKSDRLLRSKETDQSSILDLHKEAKARKQLEDQCPFNEETYVEIPKEKKAPSWLPWK